MRALLWANSKQLNKSLPGEANVANITSNLRFPNFYNFPKRSVHYNVYGIKKKILKIIQ